MKKLIIIFCSVLIFTACDFGNQNAVSLSEFDSEDAVIFENLIDSIYAFDYTAEENQYMFLNVWIDKYETGEKKGAVQSISRNYEADENRAGQIIFVTNNFSIDNNNYLEFEIIHINEEGSSSSTFVEERESSEIGLATSHGPVIDDYENIGGNEAPLVSFAVNEGESMPMVELSEIYDSEVSIDNHIKDTASEIDEFYVLKIQFSEEEFSHE